MSLASRPPPFLLPHTLGSRKPSGGTARAQREGGMAATATLPFSCSSTLKTLTRTLSPRYALRPHRLPSFPRLPHSPRLRRPISASAAPNGASSEGEYDYDLFTIGAGSGGVRASRFASTLYGARAAICEMPFATVSSDNLGGVGGTAVPSAVFSQPPIGQVGLSEEQAIEEYGDVDVFAANFRPLRATLSGLPDRVLMKVIVCATTKKVVGVHMCGEDAPEIIQGIAIAVKAGLTKQDFDATVGIHPTSAEEFVTMRNVNRKVRRSNADEVESQDEVVTQQ